MLDAVLKSNVSVDKIDKKGVTALAYAVRHGDLKCAEHLLKYGAKNVPDKNGRTPLLVALEVGVKDGERSNLTYAPRQSPPQICNVNLLGR